MSKKKIETIFLSFTEKDWKECRSHLYHSTAKGRKLIRLFDLYYSQKLVFPLKWSLKIGRKIQVKTNKRWLNLHQELLPEIEQYLINQYLVKQPTEINQKLILAEAYKEKGLYKLFVKTCEDSIKNIKNNPTIDLWQSFHLLKLHHSIAYSTFPDQNEIIQSLDNADHCLTDFFNSLKLFYETERQSKNILFGNRVGQGSLSNEQSTLYTILEKVKNIAKNIDEISFHDLKKSITGEQNIWSNELTESTLIYLINYSYRKIREGDMKFGIEVANLLKFSLDNKIYPGKMSFTRFSNIVDAISKFKPEENVPEIINKHIHSVNHADLESCKQICLASFHFSQLRFEKTLNILNNSTIKTVDFNIGFHFRIMLLGALCMKKDGGNLFFNSVDSAKKYFYRNKRNMAPHLYKAVLHYINALVFVKTNESYQFIKDYINNCDEFAQKFWFITVLNKLAKPT
ncbi:MAG: hypothetical protein V3V14_12130 [Saprospiraceae bacterium]